MKQSSRKNSTDNQNQQPSRGRQMSKDKIQSKTTKVSNTRGKNNNVSKTSMNKNKTSQVLAEPARPSSNARLADLCQDDKAKIGDLVKKLAGETKEKLEYQRKYDEEATSNSSVYEVSSTTYLTVDLKF